jgi:hypothetical protein
MKRAAMPSIADPLLSFVASEHPALAGDLVEERLAGRSRRWFWIQLIAAVLLAAWTRRRYRPIVVRLVTATPYDRPDRERGLLDPAMIILTGTYVRSVGGLSLLALVVLTTIAMPQTWLLAAAGLAGGVVLGIVLIRRRQGIGLSGPRGSGPLRLSEPTRPDAAPGAGVPGPGLRLADAPAV